MNNQFVVMETEKDRAARLKVNAGSTEHEYHYNGFRYYYVDMSDQAIAILKNLSDALLIIDSIYRGVSVSLNPDYPGQIVSPLKLNILITKEDIQLGSWGGYTPTVSHIGIPLRPLSAQSNSKIFEVLTLQSFLNNSAYSI